MPVLPRGRVVAAIVLATTLLMTAVLVADGAASAATTRPRAVAVETVGDDQALVTWQRPHGARRFSVQVSASASFTGSTTRTLSTRRDEHFVVVGSLVPRTTYFVRVRAAGSRPSSWTTARRVTTAAPAADFGVMTYNLLCADYCVGGKRHNRQTFPWLERRGRVVNDLRASTNVDVVGLQEAGGYVTTGWNCRFTRGACSTPKKFAPNGKDHAYDRFCSRRRCPTRVPGGRFGGTPRQIDDVMRYLPEFGITPIVGNPNRKESGYSYVRIMWRTSTFELTRAGSLIDIDGPQYEKKLRWHRRAYWAVLTQRATGRSYFVVTAHAVADSGVTRAEGYPKGASPSAVRAAGARKLVREIRRLNTGGLPVVLTGDFNTTSARDRSLAVLRSAGYADTRAAAGASRRINDDVASGNGFDPRRVARTGTRTPVDRIFTLPGSGTTTDTRLWWLQAPMHGRLVDNCRARHRTAAPAAGCWGSDHFPVIAQLRPTASS
ncbi:MAG: endonuclease/exonuclease/phosphatase family protein [Aeromicrobium sp.]|nr:endonuclease/exonuclease/phosphatase family protein [Aeromicrobium sp.]